MQWFDAVRARLRLLFGRGAAEARMDEEIDFHVDMEADRLVREHGLDPAEARRHALIAFGGVERHREELRDGRTLAWLGGLSLDFRLGFRMLAKYPGLTIVGGLAMAFAIWAGVVTYVLLGQFLSPKLPLPDGDRIVRIEMWDAAANDPELRALSDFASWRDGLRSITDLGAYRDVPVNLIVGNDAGPPVTAAEISASAFRIAPEPPLLGRVLLPEDERPGAPAVVVIGYDVWQTRFGGEASVIGTTVRLGEEYATVVGVMPERFAFPVAHDLWTPLRIDAVYGALEGPEIEVFGRLAPGVTLEAAQAELTTIGRRASAERPETHEHLQPLVGHYAKPLSSKDDNFMRLINGFAVMLLVLICSNVALLLFARAATRETELVTRSALGASRGRLLMQLFVEALVLGGVATAAGLGAAQFALGRWGTEFLERNLGALPFWYDLNVSPSAIVYACALTLLGAVIAGILPGRKIMRSLAAQMKQNSAGGGGVRFGGVWTAVIVAQVASTIAFPVIVYTLQKELVRVRALEPGFPAERYLAVQIEHGADAVSDARATLEELRRRVSLESGVAGVTFTDKLPLESRAMRGVAVQGDVDPTGATSIIRPPPGVWATTAWIDPSYFDVLGSRVLAGRGFTTSDFAPDARAVIVDQGFVDLVAGGRNAVGRRIRLAGLCPESIREADPDACPWYTVVGVVPELGMTPSSQKRRAAGVYLPAAPGTSAPVHMVVHVRGDPLSFIPRVREIATATDPALRLATIQRVDQITTDALWLLGLWVKVALVLTALALLLSMAGIYAVLSYTVARRTREIGVRVALGASHRRIVTAIFRRPLIQVGVGVTVGFVLVTAAAWFLSGHQPDGAPRAADSGLSLLQVAGLVLHALVMMGVSTLACALPVRRALGVQPTEALRAE